MMNVQYRILECVSSQLAGRGIDILVVLRLENTYNPSLRAYLWNDWISAMRDQQEFGASYIEDFINDLRRHLVAGSEYEIGEFFEMLHELSVGPLRTSASGVCPLEELDSSVVFDWPRRLLPLSGPAFSDLIARLLQHDSQPQL